MGDATMICLDIGSLYTRIGPCGEDAPVDVFATEVDSATGEVGYSDTRKNAIKAVQKGHVVDTNAIEKVWEYSVNSMRPHCDQNVNPGVIINFRPNMTDKEKSHLAEFMFEGLDVSCLGIGEEGPLSLYASGRGSGFMVHSGEGCTHFSSIIEGRYSAKPKMADIPSGEDLTEIVQKSLRQQYWRINSYEARLVKESLGRNQEEYELPNGTKLNVSRVKNHIEHALFDEGKLHEKMHRYIECSDEFQRSLLYYNVIFSGGNTFLYFFEKEPMLNRLSTVTNTNTLLCRTNRGNIVLPPERKFSVWIGGSILGSLSTFQYGNELNFSKDEYNEKGIERFALHNYMLDDLQ